jgi:uncharacterized repeat protein (TIGR01451 family)
MKHKLLRHLLLWMGVLGAAVHAQAAGTPAGSVISNTATVTYNVAAGPTVTVPSNTSSFTVSELLNVTSVSNDAGNVSTLSPDTNKVLSFTITNTGNGTETYSLTATRTGLPGDQFDPSVGSAGSIFIENGLQPGFQATGPNADTLYIAGVNDPILNANNPSASSKTVYLVSDIPGGVANGDTGKASITASSTTPGAAGATAGTSLAGLGDGGVDAVVGSSQGTASITGTYQVSSFNVAVTKTASVLDPFGGTKVVPGAVITYTITVDVTGTGQAQSVIVNDPIPANTTYVPGSLKVNGAARTDATDGDNAQIAAGNAQATFGNMTAPLTNILTFQATVN